jgi:hypothetical protein
MHGRNVTDAGRKSTEIRTIRESSEVKGTVLIILVPPSRNIYL